MFLSPSRFPRILPWSACLAFASQRSFFSFSSARQFLIPFIPSSSPSQYLYALEFTSATLTIGTLGAFSDYMGRKKVLLISSCGQFIYLLLFLLALTHASSSSSSPSAAPSSPSSPSSYRAARICLFVATFVNGLTGSYGTYLSGLYAYAAGTSLSVTVLLLSFSFPMGGSPPFPAFPSLLWASEA